MAGHFDAHQAWLGIAPTQQPADYYRLLSVRRFERNLEVIANALEQRNSLVSKFLRGERAAEAQQVLGELAAAGACLLEPDRKESYDRQLRQADALPPTRPATPASRSPVKQTVPHQPSPAPHQPASVPVQPASAPVQPPPAPHQPASAPVQPASALVQPPPAPHQPPPAPYQPATAPHQPAPAPYQPAPAPYQPGSAPHQPATASYRPAPYQLASVPYQPASAQSGPVAPAGPNRSTVILVVVILAFVVMTLGVMVVGASAVGIWWIAGRSKPNAVANKGIPADPQVTSTENTVGQGGNNPPSIPTPISKEDEWLAIEEPNLAWTKVEPAVAAQIEADRERLLAGLPVVPSEELMAAFMQGVRPAGMPPGGFGPPGAFGPGGPAPPGAFGPGGPIPGGPIPPGAFPGGTRPGFGPGGPPASDRPVPELAEQFVLTGLVNRIRYGDDGVWLSLTSSGALVPPENLRMGFPPFPLIRFEDPAVAPLLSDYRAGDSVRVAVRRTDWSKRPFPAASTTSDWDKTTPLVAKYGSEMRLFLNPQSAILTAPRWVFLAQGIQKEGDNGSWVDAKARRVVRLANAESVAQSLAWRTRGGTSKTALRGKLRGFFNSVQDGGSEVRVSFRTGRTPAGEVFGLQGSLPSPARIEEFSDYRSEDEIIAYGQVKQALSVPLPAAGRPGLEKLTLDPDFVTGLLAMTLDSIQKKGDEASFVRTSGPRRENLELPFEVVHANPPKHMGKEVHWRGSLDRICRYKGETHILVIDKKSGNRVFECYTRDPNLYASLADYRDGYLNSDVVLVAGRIGDQDAALFRMRHYEPLIELKSVQRVNYAPSLAEVGKVRDVGTFKRDRMATPADELLRDLPRVGEIRTLEARFDMYNESTQVVSFTLENWAKSTLRPDFPDKSKADFANRKGRRARLVVEFAEEPSDIDSGNTHKWKGRSIEWLDPSTVAAEKSPPSGRPRKPPPGTEASPPPSNNASTRLEELATISLRVAKSLDQNGNKDVARQRYEDIIKKYPTTKAAEEARALLEAP